MTRTPSQAEETLDQPRKLRTDIVQKRARARPQNEAIYLTQIREASRSRRT